MRPGKETRDIFQDCPAAIKAVCSPLAASTLFIKHSELLDVQDRRTGRLCVLVLSGVFSQTLFHRLSVCEIWVLVLFVIEGSRTLKTEGHPSQEVARRVELRRSSNSGGVPV